MNTPNKRASAIGIGLAIRLVLPVPDGTVQQPDRQQVAYSYAGIQAANPVPIPDMLFLRNVRVTAAASMANVRVAAEGSMTNVTVQPAASFVNIRVIGNG